MFNSKSVLRSTRVMKETHCTSELKIASVYETDEFHKTTRDKRKKIQLNLHKNSWESHIFTLFCFEKSKNFKNSQHFFLYF